MSHVAGSDGRGEHIVRRLTLAAAVLVMAAACVAILFYLVWQGQQDAREFNAALVRKLDELASPGKTDRGIAISADGSTPLRVRLVAKKTPARGRSANGNITLLSLMNESYYKPSRSAMSDDHGLTDFGPIRDGNYRLLVEVPERKYLLQNLVLSSGHGDLAIECPTTPHSSARPGSRLKSRNGIATASCATR